MPSPDITPSSARDILVACMTDAMNRYVNQALIPTGVISETIWRDTSTGLGSDIMQQRNAIVNSIADRWEKALEARLQRQK